MSDTGKINSIDSYLRINSRMRRMYAIYGILRAALAHYEVLFEKIVFAHFKPKVFFFY